MLSVLEQEYELTVCTVNVENFTEMVRNCAGKRDLIVSASMECVRCCEVVLNAGRHPHRCGCESH